MRRILLYGLLGALLSIHTACRSSAPPPSPPTLPADELPFLLEPTGSYPGEVDPALRLQIKAGFDSFHQGRPPAEVERVAREILLAAPGQGAASILLAEAVYLQRRYQESGGIGRQVLSQNPDYLAAILLTARSAERLGESFESFELYRRIGHRSPVAAEKAAALMPQAVENVRGRFQAALDEQRIADAEALAVQLDTWLPDSTEALDARFRIAVAKADARTELELLRALVARQPSRSYRERQAELEVAMGDVRSGLSQLEALAREFPEDTKLPALVDRAKFRWHLERLPARVQRIARNDTLTRADLAALLYWLVPKVRYSPTIDPPIAGDILNHPGQQEILRVADYGLLEIDETLHRFNPEATASRRLSLHAALSLLAKERIPCATAGERTAGRDARALTCRRAVECGLALDEAACLRNEAISGSEMVDILKRCLDLMGANE
jgi:hypothetical protein